MSFVSSFSSHFSHMKKINRPYNTQSPFKFSTPKNTILFSNPLFISHFSNNYSTLKTAAELEQLKPAQKRAYLPTLGKDGIPRLRRLRNVYITFDKLSEKNKLNAIHVTKALAKAAEFAKPQNAADLYQQLPGYGIKPDIIILNAMLNAAAKGAQPKYGIEFFNEFERNNIQPDVKSYHSMIECFGRAGDSVTAEKYYQQLKDSNIKPDVQLFGALIQSCVMNGETEKAERFYNEMVSLNIAPSVLLFNVLIQTCRKNAETEKAERFLKMMVEQGLKPQQQTFIFLVGAAGEDVESIDRILLEMKQLDLFPGVEVLTAAITGASKTGNISKAEEYLDLMYRSKLEPNRVTYYFLMVTCYNAKDIIKGDSYYRTMVLGKKMRPNNFANLLHKKIHDDIQERAKVEQK